MAERIEELPKQSRGRQKQYDFKPYYDGKPWAPLTSLASFLASGLPCIGMRESMI
jgi:hypothetical protein